jgi:phosphoribosylanthranilate isomerase
MTVIKICGVTNFEDALHAARSGADALGFNFFSGSPRYVTPETVASITRSLPPQTAAIGVFVNESPENIRAAVVCAGLTAVQLHGDESPQEIEAVRQTCGVKLIRAVRVRAGSTLSPDELENDHLLIDAFSEKEFGGTGETADIKVAEAIIRRHPRVFLAGGLSPDNVSSALKKLRPYGVDACSRLEIKPGKKDPHMVERFIEEVRSAL